MKNEEVVKLIQEYHEKRIENLEGSVSIINKEMGEVIGKIDGVDGKIKGLCKVIDNNNFWLKVIGIGTPGTTFVLWIIIQLLEKYRG